MSAKTKRPRRFTDAGVQALAEFSDKVRGVFWDTDVTGLRLRVGARKLSWNYYTQRRRRGRVETIFRPLGDWPAVNVEDARKAARIVSGELAAGKAMPSKREAIKFGMALDGYDDDKGHHPGYIEYLRAKAEKAGKPPRWAKNVEQLAQTILRPQWGSWSLVEMSDDPAAVHKWHADATKKHGPVSANHAARIVRAVYRRAAKLNRTLPPALPTSAVEFNKERPSQKGLALADFPKWRKAWDKLDSPMHQAYHLCAILTGPRPGELARLKWPDVLPRERCFVFRGAKAENDIRVPLTPAITRALRMARDAQRADKIETEFVFPGCAQVGHRDPLPARGNMLRHTFRTIATDCGVDEMLAHFLMGHSPEGISQKYIVKMILASGPALREAQRKISRRIVGLLGIGI
jgi:integrase